MAQFSGKVAIVMGASAVGGMGEATARRLVKEGCHVVISGRTRDSLQAIAAEIGCEAFAADITRQDEVSALVDFTIERFGALHLGVNHVGLADRCSAPDITEAHLMKMTQINYFGTVWFITSLAARMEPGGAIVTTSTISAYDAMPGIAAYASAKRAADRFVQAAAVEYAEKRLRINSIIPSINDTNMLRKGVEEYGYEFDDFVKSYIPLTPLGRISHPEDVAAMMCMLLGDDYFDTGQLIHCGGGISLLGQPRIQ